MNMYDAVIVGAGPAGCSAAYDLTRKGRSVLLLDNKPFPRTKACAGALTVRAVEALRYSIRPVVRRVCNDIVAGLRLESSYRMKSRYPICAMTVRSEFDHYCLEETLKAGAELRIIHRIHSVAQNADHVSINLGQDEVKARFLIGADGAQSRVRALTGNDTWARLGLAIEACVKWRNTERMKMEFDFGIVERGYGWLFPKHDHLNLGIYTYYPSVKLTRGMLADYVSGRLGQVEMHSVVGYPIGFGGASYRPSRPRVFLTGDAAGLVDPLLGEGIYYAIRSGQIAASAILCELTGAGEALPMFREGMAPVQKELASRERWARRFYVNVNRGQAFLTAPFVRSAMMKGYARGMNFLEIKRSFPILPFLPVKTPPNI